MFILFTDWGYQTKQGNKTSEVKAEEEAHCKQVKYRCQLLMLSKFNEHLPFTVSPKQKLSIQRKGVNPGRLQYET